MSEGKNLVGVDIGSSSIKLCEIKEGRGGKRVLTHFGYQPLPPRTIVDGHVINSGAVVEALNRLFDKRRNRNVAIRISGHSVIIKKITMPLMTPAELSEQITWEAEHHIPFDLAEVEMDWQIVQERADQRQMDVLLVAAKKEDINDLLNLATDAKLKPKVIDLDAFALQNVFELGYGIPPAGSTVALLHVGASLTTLNVISQGTTAFTRELTTGGNAITEHIQRTLSISAEEAEAYKCGGDGRGLVPREVPEIVQEVVDRIADDVQRSLDFYLATSGEGDISKIFLSGGTANIRAVVDALEKRTRVQAEVVDPTRVVSLDPKGVNAQLFQLRAAQSPVALGLALRKEREKTR